MQLRTALVHYRPCFGGGEVWDAKRALFFNSPGGHREGAYTERKEGYVPAFPPLALTLFSPFKFKRRV